MVKPSVSGTVSLDPSPDAPAGARLALQALDLVVVDVRGHANALEFLRGAKTLRRRIEDHWSTITRNVDELKRRLLDLKRADLKPVEDAIATATRAALDYEAAERARVEAEQARRRREAEAVARAAREAELQAQIAAAPKGQKAAARREAETVRATPVAVVVPEVQAELGKVAGVSHRTTVSVEVFDVAAFREAVRIGAIAIGAVEPNMPYLQQAARALPPETFAVAYPGCRAVVKTTIAG